MSASDRNKDKTKTPNPPQIKNPGSTKEIEENKVKEPEDVDKPPGRPSK